MIFYEDIWPKIEVQTPKKADFDMDVSILPPPDVIETKIWTDKWSLLDIERRDVLRLGGQWYFMKTIYQKNGKSPQNVTEGIW